MNTEAEPTQISRTGGGNATVTLGTTVVMCAASAAVAVIISLFAPAIAAKHGIKLPGAKQGEQVVYLDFERVITAGMKRTMNSGRTGVDEVRRDADEFQAAVTAEVQRYSDGGYIVINSKALIGADKSKDITGDVLTTLGFQ